MLFLTRKIGESIVINGEITLTVAGIGTNNVKLSFNYPQGTRVLRQEVYDRIQAENKLAAQQTEQIHTLLKTNKQLKKFIPLEATCLIPEDDPKK